MDLTKTVAAGLSKQLGDLADGATGTYTGSDFTIDYNKTSAASYGVLAKNADGASFLHMQVTDSAYILQMDFAKIPVSMRDASSPTEGALEVTLTFANESSWKVSVFAQGMACDSQDPTAPSQFKLVFDKEAGLWSGKVMMYSGRGVRGAGETTPTCSTVVSDDRSTNYYTDFVANDAAAKVNGYVMKRDVSNFVSEASNTTYALSNLCHWYASNFGISESVCDATAKKTVGGVQQDVHYSTDYTNSYCIDSTGTTTWGNNCSSTDVTVSTAAFGTPNNWIEPALFYTTHIVLPSSL
jgi:hypothetical protein